jgi:hypothetical protein
MYSVAVRFAMKNPLIPNTANQGISRFLVTGTAQK